MKLGQTEAAAGRESRRVKRQGYNSFDSDLGEYPQYDVDLMQRVFKTPLKRQWCRSGMSFNPVIGTCTLSLAFLLS
nr:hypothetical protein BaRGS_033252 [Batillaria attramentaria]